MQKNFEWKGKEFHKTFSEKVLAAHKKITAALLRKNPDQTREEMFKHIREVEKDLILLQEARHKQ